MGHFIYVRLRKSRITGKFLNIQDVLNDIKKPQIIIELRPEICFSCISSEIWISKYSSGKKKKYIIA